MKKENIVNIIIFVIACILLVCLVRADIKEQVELEQKTKNVETLLGEIERYKAKDSANAVEIGILTLTLEQAEKYRSELLQESETLRIRNKDLQSILQATSESKASYSTVVRDTIYNQDTVRIYEYRDKYTDIRGSIEGDTIKGDVSIYDTLTVIKHVERKRFLCIRYGIKDVRVSVKNANPNVKINNVEIIEIIK
jgi:hypothetical protein